MNAFSPSLKSQQAQALRASLAALYDVVEKDIRINGSDFRLLKVLDTNKLVDAIAPEEFANDERLPYWAEIWPSSLVLAELCLKHIDLRNKRVLELGCGLGLAGIAASKAGARITLSDYEQHSLDFSRFNALLNLTDEQDGRVDYQMLDWRNIPVAEPFDVILAADCVYERRNFFPLIEVLNTLLKPEGVAVFTEPGRSIGEFFFSLLREQGFDVKIDSHPAMSHGKPIEVVQATICKARDAHARPSST